MPEAAYIQALQRVAEELKDLETKVSGKRDSRLTYMWEARRMGASYSSIAAAAGVTKAYVHQVLKAERLRQEAENNGEA